MVQEFLKQEASIRQWLDTHHVNNYTLHPDEKYGFVVDVYGHVSLHMDEEVKENLEQYPEVKVLQHIPVKFRTVTGSFWCYYQELRSLEFCPEYVGKEFDCRFNQLETLEFCPKHVGTFFNCFGNPLLGAWQDERNFSKILVESQRIQQIKLHKEYLEKSLASSVATVPRKKI